MECIRVRVRAVAATASRNAVIPFGHRSARHSIAYFHMYATPSEQKIQKLLNTGAWRYVHHKILSA
jgi:hypothetical protein